MSDTTEPKRAPMLSDEAIDSWSSWEYGERANHAIKSFIKICRDFYEAKITSGELIVSDWPPIKQGPPVWSCLKCGWYDLTVDYQTPQSHCPRCNHR